MAIPKWLYDHDDVKNGPAWRRWTIYAGFAILPLALLFLILVPRDGPEGGIVFGDDSSSRAFNDTCDDPRFTGPAAGRMLSASDMGRDASDCQRLYRVAEGLRGRFRGPSVRYNALFNEPATQADLDYGDDSGPNAGDGQCDDMRFATSDMIVMRMDSAIGGDASDCRTAVAEGRAQWVGDPVGRSDLVGQPAQPGPIQFDLQQELADRQAAETGKPNGKPK
ncbi:hypothetical protein [Aurantiacibacter gangjinensis]|uniref:hypothetical protein n=1 Tax=Aurantiacibacter gangjinensis TaxID=502682 RepID=UPI00069C7264|nr:hypothetical protein [Aurantiacibacter gangjinensis]APE29048.1 hypothetical protein BMF35_a2219 [Aurantiacibacter gangjinensis]